MRQGSVTFEMAVASPLGLRHGEYGIHPSQGGLLPTMEGERRTFGELLRHYRRRKYRNLEHLAEKLGTSKDVLSNYENDKIRPAHEILLRLIAELEMPALPLLRALDYPLERPTITYEDLIAEDDNLDDDGKEFIRRALLHEYDRAERRESGQQSTMLKKPVEKVRGTHRNTRIAG